MKKLSTVVLLLVGVMLLSSGVVFSQMPDLGSISGTVSDAATMEPIGHASVMLSRAGDHHFHQFVFSGDDGGYTFENLRPGTYMVGSTKEGYLPAQYADSIVVNEDDITGIDIAMQALVFGTMAGTITDATTGDPLAGVHVSASMGGMHPFHRDAVTGDDGTYMIDELPPGAYMVEGMKEGYVRGQYPDPVDVNGDDITGIDFTLQELVFGSISGTVTDAGTGDPLAYVHVAVDMGGNHHMHRDAVTGDDGTYMIDDMPPGVYFVHAGKWGYYPQDYPDSIVMNGDDFTGIDFALEPLVFGGIAGVVTDAGTMEPVAGAMVTAIGGGWPFHHNWAFTDENGEYAMELLAGTYHIEVNARGYMPYTSPDSIVVDGEIIDGVDIALTPIDLGSISGTVFTDSGLVVPNAAVDIFMYHGWFHMRTHSDSLGNYTFEDVYPGSYSVRAFAQGFRQQRYDSMVVVDNGADVTGIDFYLTPIHPEYNGFISGVVTDDSTGDPISNAILFASSTQGGHRNWIRRAHTNDEGQYIFNNLPEVPFKVMCIAFGYRGEFYDNQMSYQDADPVTPDAENINFGLAPREGGMRLLSGNITENNLPLDGGIVLATLDGEIVDVTASCSDGFYSFTNLEPGDYTIDVIGSNENVQASIEVPVVLNDYYDADIALSPTGVNDQSNALPTRTTLLQNYPNPFNPTTNIQFYLASAGDAELSVYDLLGRKVSTLVSGTLEAGTHTFTWNGKDSSGEPVSSGMYLYILKTADKTYSNRMVLLK